MKICLERSVKHVVEAPDTGDNCRDAEFLVGNIEFLLKFSCL